MPTLIAPTPYQLGEAAGYLFKTAGDPELSYSMAGELYVTPKNWGLLSVPNALVRGAFDALHEVGLELPYNSEGRLNAHASIFRPEEIEQIGGAKKITDAGHHFRYTLGPVRTVTPDGWEGVSKVWMISVRSPELEKLRKSYGLSPLPNDNQHEFHITIARRRRGVLQHNDIAKQAMLSVPGDEGLFSVFSGPITTGWSSENVSSVSAGVPRCQSRSSESVAEREIPGEGQATRTTAAGRTIKAAGTQDLARDLGEDDQFERGELSVLRSQGDYGLRKMAYLLGVHGGHGSETDVETLDREEGHGRSLRAGQLRVGGYEGSAAEQEKQSQADGQRHHADTGGMGRRTGSECVDYSDAAEAGLDGRKSGHNSGSASSAPSTITKQSAVDLLPGGLADGKPDSAFSLQALIAGRKVESEHTSLQTLANEIAKDHLTEDPDYYKKLKKMEGKEAKQDRPVPDDWNEPADRESCPVCGVMHERGDGFCNSCGERWPAKTASLFDLFGEKQAKGMVSSLLGMVKKPPPLSGGTPAASTLSSVFGPLKPPPVTAPVTPQPGLMKSMVKMPVTAVKNQFGMGVDGPLAVPKPVAKPSGLSTANPAAWARFGVDKGLTGLADSSAAGKAVATTARSVGHAVTTNPLRSTMDAVRPGLGQHANKVTATSIAAPLVYGGYKAQRALPDAVDTELTNAGVDPGIRDDQWWRLWRAQPKMLWHGLAPASMGGDPTPVGKLPTTVAKHVVTDTPLSVGSVSAGSPTVGKVITRSPTSYLPTPTNVLRHTALRNVSSNMANHMPAILGRSAVDVGKEVAKDPRASIDSPLLQDTIDAIDPRLYADPDTRKKILRHIAGYGADAVHDEMSVRGYIAPQPYMTKDQYGYYEGRTADGSRVSYVPKYDHYELFDPKTRTWSVIPRNQRPTTVPYTPPTKQ